MANVLIIDDQEIIRDLIQDALEEKGYKITTAEDGVEALELCRKHTFDVVITDVCMPRLEGVAVVRSLKSDYPKTKVIVVSGANYRKEYLGTAENFGADAILEKPVDLDSLCEVIEKLCA
ncbi:MAG: response regulator [Chitinivibrionales bacterium]|nr:response regulator [Chitinivibrionales bacterium]MBD3356754.1 response regulator [Chitinivibrionales bacterium]